MEKISVDCPNCNSTLKAPPEFAGKVATCPDCGTKVRVPIGPSAPQGTPPPAGPPKRKPPAAAPAAAPAGIATDEFADEFGVDTEAADDPFAAAPAGAPGRGRRKKKPNIDPKYLAIGGAAVLFIAAVFWFTMMRGGAGAAMNYMPDGTAVVGVVHYDDMMNSKFVKTARKKFPQAKDMDSQLERQFGDVSEKVDRITFGGNPDENEMLMYIELNSGTSVDEIRKEMSKQKFKRKKTVGGYKIYASREGKGSEGFCLLDSSTILSGSPKLIEDVLEREGKPKLAKGMSSALAEADMSKSMCIAMTLKGMKGGPGMGMPGGEVAAAAMKKAEAAIFTVDVGSDLDFDVTLVCDDSDDAKDLKKKVDDGMEQFEGLALIALGKAGKKLMEDIKVKSSGKKLTIAGSVSTDTIEDIADKLKKSGGRMPFGS